MTEEEELARDRAFEVVKASNVFGCFDKSVVACCPFDHEAIWKGGWDARSAHDGWREIKIEADLPRLDGACLITADNGIVRCVYFNARKLIFLSFDGGTGYNATAWMPLPAPFTPKEATEDNCPHINTKRLVLPANKRKRFDEPFAYHCKDCNRTFGDDPAPKEAIKTEVDIEHLARLAEVPQFDAMFKPSTSQPE